MRLVKIFRGEEHEAVELEQQINEWVVTTKASIVAVTGNIAPQSLTSYPDKKPAPSDLFVVVVYEPALIANDSPDAQLAV